MLPSGDLLVPLALDNIHFLNPKQKTAGILQAMQKSLLFLAEVKHLSLLNYFISCNLPPSQELCFSSSLALLVMHMGY